MSISNINSILYRLFSVQKKKKINKKLQYGLSISFVILVDLKYIFVEIFILIALSFKVNHVCKIGRASCRERVLVAV